MNNTRAKIMIEFGVALMAIAPVVYFLIFHDEITRILGNHQAFRAFGGGGMDVILVMRGVQLAHAAVFLIGGILAFSAGGSSMQWHRAAFLAPMLAGLMMLPPMAGASPQQAEQTLVACLKGKVNPADTLVCIGQYSDACAAKADQAAPVPQIAEQSQCLLDEAAAWETLRSRAVQSWKKDNGTSFSSKIADIAKAGQRFAVLKCSIFRDTEQFGQTGMALEAECLRDEAAKSVIFIGYSLH